MRLGAASLLRLLAPDFGSSLRLTGQSLFLVSGGNESFAKDVEVVSVGFSVVKVGGTASLGFSETS